jgi:hypothetical protein
MFRQFNTLAGPLREAEIATRQQEEIGEPSIWDRTKKAFFNAVSPNAMATPYFEAQRTAQDLPKYSDPAEIANQFKDSGITLDPDLPIPKDGATLARLEVMNETLQANKRDQAVLENKRPGVAGTVAEIGGGLVGVLADPINFIPFAGGISKAKAAVGAGRAAAIRAGALAGAVEGAAAAAVADAVAIPSANEWGANIGWGQALADVTLGGALGGALGGLGGFIGTRKMAKVHQDALTRAAADADAGREIDVSDIFKPVEETARRASQRLIDDPDIWRTLIRYDWDVRPRADELLVARNAWYDAHPDVPRPDADFLRAQAMRQAEREILGPRIQELLRARADYYANPLLARSTAPVREVSAQDLERVMAQVRTEMWGPNINEALDLRMNGERVSFERATPDNTAELAAQMDDFEVRAADEMGASAPSAGSEAENLELLLMEENLAAERLAGNLTEADEAVLRSADDDIVRAEQTGMAYADAVECVLQFGTGAVI